MISLPPPCRAWLVRAVRFLLRRGTRRALAWLALLGSLAIAIEWAWTCYDDVGRRDGNYGHATIDFGGQWLMGRMLVTGNGRRLYDRIALRRVLEEAYPRADSEDPRIDQHTGSSPVPTPTSKPGESTALSTAGSEAKAGDVEHLLDWLLGQDDPEDAAQLGGYLAPLAATHAGGAAALVAAGRESWQPIKQQLGGALYPPINAYLYAPLGLLPPRLAYRLMQTFDLALLFAIAVLVQRISGGRVWWEVAAILLMGFPGFSGAFNLAQNTLFSVFLLVLGWRQLQVGRPVLAGVVWGLMAFKPVWAVAFFLVPLLTRRWRMALAMAVTGAVLSASTLPVTGSRVWVDWLALGSEASDTYARCETWIFLSRDLMGVPRRYLLTFAKDAYSAPDDPRAARATALGMGLWFAPLAVTVAAVVRRGRRGARVTGGPQAAFVLLGAWLACYHFMYYDVLLAYLPCCLLYAEPRRVWRRATRGMPPGTWRGLARSALATALLVSLSVFPYLASVRDITCHFPPWDTLCLALLWLWCDLARGQRSAPGAQLGDGSPRVGGAHERLANEDCPHPSREQQLHVSAPADAAFTHQADARRDSSGNLEGMPQAGYKRP
jgi:arabinofuranan 3-O-arabinosyltransferase